MNPKINRSAAIQAAAIMALYWQDVCFPGLAEPYEVALSKMTGLSRESQTNLTCTESDTHPGFNTIVDAA